MTKKTLAFGLILASLLVLTTQASLKSLSKQCLCDITDQCDAQCCCDASCSSSFITLWNNYKLCLDDSFGIPFCSQIAQNDVNVIDLHSGLRTIYTVIKRLFCISSVNFVQPQNWFKKSVLDSDLQTEFSSINSAQSQSIADKNILSLTQFPIAGLPLKGSNGLCRSSSQLTKNNEKSASCRVYLSSAANIGTSLLSINNLDAALGISLKKYDTKTISTGIVTSQTLSTVCAGTDCSNVIRRLQIFINSETGSIDPSSYAVLGPISITQAGYISIDYEYTFISVNNNQVVMPQSSKIGYTFGSRLNLLYKDSGTNYYKIVNPLSLAFRKPDGSCRTSSIEQAGNSYVDIKFGVNQAISCLGTSNVLYQNLALAFNWVGKYGVSSNKLSQYLNVTLPSAAVSTSQSVQLLIYYVNIGSAQNVQYEISKVQINAVTSKDGVSTLYIEFVSVENSYNMFVPPAPIVDAYLPNDFLYPFFVA